MLSTSLELLGVTPPGQGVRQLLVLSTAEVQARFNGRHRWESQVVSMETA